MVRPSSKVCKPQQPRGAIVGFRLSKPMPSANFLKAMSKLHSIGYQVYASDHVIQSDLALCPNCGAKHHITIYLWQGTHQKLDPMFTVCLDCFTAVQEVPIYESEVGL